MTTARGKRAARYPSPPGSGGRTRDVRARDFPKGSRQDCAPAGRSRLGAHRVHPATVAKASPPTSPSPGPPRSSGPPEVTHALPSAATPVPACTPPQCKAAVDSFPAAPCTTNTRVKTSKGVTWADHVGAPLCSVHLPRILGPLGAQPQGPDPVCFVFRHRAPVPVLPSAFACSPAAAQDAEWWLQAAQAEAVHPPVGGLP